MAGLLQGTPEPTPVTLVFSNPLTANGLKIYLRQVRRGQVINPTLALLVAEIVEGLDDGG